ncbi:hypothetical protein OROHE_008621 [Orobanche hederae]
MGLILFIGPKMAMSLNRSVILVRAITDAAHRIIPEAIFSMEAIYLKPVKQNMC